ncbi:MAG: hypothetical protein HKN47_15080 [Pirellulaceae bacterium]|nr:hypothetical protein [Pirellulaceae bacterium]
MRSSTLMLLGCLASLLISASDASAQLTTPRTLSAAPDRFATLEEQLTNRLRATTRQQRGYVQFVVAEVKKGRLDFRLVVAIERYALKRKPDYPFPFFEQALRHEAAKRGVKLPAIQQFATTKITSE